ncbi:Gamma-1-syntrophin, partial [Sarracenia purpurea var. burkii]
VRSGMVNVSDGKSLPVTMRLYLTVDELHLQKQEMCQVDMNSLEGEEDTPSENEVSILKRMLHAAGALKAYIIHNGNKLV